MGRPSSESSVHLSPAHDRPFLACLLFKHVAQTGSPLGSRHRHLPDLFFFLHVLLPKHSIGFLLRVTSRRTRSVREKTSLNDATQAGSFSFKRQFLSHNSVIYFFFKSCNHQISMRLQWVFFLMHTLCWKCLQKQFLFNRCASILNIYGLFWGQVYFLHPPPPLPFTCFLWYFVLSPLLYDHLAVCVQE